MLRHHRYGWRPDLPDRRDHVRLCLRRGAIGLPDSIDLRAQMPPVYDQGALGSCTGNAIAAAIEYVRRREGLADFTPSRLFIYYNERAIEGTIGIDAGAEIRDGIKSVARLGACSEGDWPYDIAKFAQQPPAACYADARTDLVTRYARVPQTLDSVRDCLAAGLPVIFGFTVYESFESDAVAASGVLPLPGPHEKVLGGHAVLAVGYDDAKEMLTVRNSWGPSWGDAGYFRMPYAYAMDENLADDFWQIETVAAA